MAIKFNMRVEMSITVDIGNENQPLPFSRTEMTIASRFDYTRANH